MAIPIDLLAAAFGIAASAASLTSDSLSLAERAGIKAKLAARLKRSPQQESFARALARAHEIFSNRYPDLEASLFDGQLLEHSADLLLATSMYPTNIQELAAELAAVWSDLVPANVAAKNRTYVQAAATDLLALLEQELLKEVEFRDLLQAHYAKENSKNTGHLVQLLSDLKEDIIAKREAPTSPQESRPIYKPPFDDEALLIAPQTFIGRKEELQWLKNRIGRRDNRHHLLISGVYGLSGVGKTALVSEAVRQTRAKGRFKDGIAVINCVGVYDAVQIVSYVLARFDPHRQQPVATDTVHLIDACRYFLQDKDILVVLDDIEPSLPIKDVLAPLRSAAVCTVVTARHVLRFQDLPPSSCRKLSQLNKDDAIGLFVSGLDISREHLGAREVHCVEEIVTALDMHAFAIRVASAYASSAHRDFSALALEIQDPHRILDVGDLDTSSSIAHILMRSIETLPSASRTLLYALGAFTSPQFSRNVARAIGKTLLLDDAELCIDILLSRNLADASVDFQMPDNSDRERLQLHALIHAIAVREFERSRSDEVYEAIASYFRDYVIKVDVQALQVDEININAALDWTQAHSRDDLFIALCKGMRKYWRFGSGVVAGLYYLPQSISVAKHSKVRTNQSSGMGDTLDLELTYGHLLLHIGNIARAEEVFLSNLYAREQEGDEIGQNAAHVAIARILQQQGKLGDAQVHLFKALEIDMRLRDLRGIGVIFLELGATALLATDINGAMSCYSNGLAIMRFVDDRHQIAVATAGLAQVARHKGELDHAETLLKSSLEIRRETGDTSGEGADLTTLGQICRVRGEFAQANSYLGQALVISKRLRDVRDQAVIIAELGQIALTLRNYEKASSYFDQSLAIEHKLQHKRGVALSLHSLGLLAIARNQVSKARDLFEQTIALAREVNDKDTLANGLNSLGKVFRILGEFSQAKQTYLEALQICREISDPVGTALSCEGLGALAAHDGDYIAAKDHFIQSLSYLEQGGDVVNRAHQLMILGSFLVNRMKLLEEGRDYFTQGITVLRQLGLPINAQEQQLAEQLGYNFNE